MIAVGQPGHIDQIKQTNAGAVYRLIDQLGPISRIELSKRAQLAPASITKIVRELLEAHLVKETEYQEIGSRGRPAVGLVLDTEAWHYLSARISRGSITLALRDLSSKLVVEELLPLAAEHPEPLLKRILTEVDQFFIRHQSKLERLTAIAITLPGMIDVQSGVVHRMPFYDVLEMPLGPALETRTGLPVYLQHDISAWTMAEALYGASRGSQNVIQVVIDHNVGAGVITGGHVLHAGSHSVVEIGHTQVDPYGKRCYCGNHGCLETVASIENMLEIAQQRLSGSMSSSLHGAPLTVESLCDAALAGISWRGTSSSASATAWGAFWLSWSTCSIRRRSWWARRSTARRRSCIRPSPPAFASRRCRPTASRSRSNPRSSSIRAPCPARRW